MRPYLIPPWTDSHPIWDVDVFHHAPQIHGIQNTEIQTKVFCDVIVSVLYYALRLSVSRPYYHIYSNKRPGHLDKSFWVGAYLFQHLLQGLTQNWMIFAIFRLILSQIEFDMTALRIDLGRWLIILWFTTLQYNGWGLIGAWAAIKTNMVLIVLNMCLKHANFWLGVQFPLNEVDGKNRISHCSKRNKIHGVG